MKHQNDRTVYLQDEDWELLEGIRQKHKLRSRSAAIAWLIEQQFSTPAPREVPKPVKDQSSPYDYLRTPTHRKE